MTVLVAQRLSIDQNDSVGGTKVRYRFMQKS